MSAAAKHWTAAEARALIEANGVRIDLAAYVHHALRTETDDA